MKTTKKLDSVAARINASLDRMHECDNDAVEADIAARRHEMEAGRDWALSRDDIIAECKRIGIKESKWTKERLRGSISAGRRRRCSVQTMRRRRQLWGGWELYEPRRRAEGDNGYYGLLYALSLIKRRERNEEGMNAHPVSSLHGKATTRDLTHLVDLIIDDCRHDLMGRETGSVNVSVTSPPYWPTARYFNGSGIGHEDDDEAYRRNLREVFRELYRVTHDEGCCWVILGDSRATAGGPFRRDSFKVGRQRQKQIVPEGHLIPGVNRPAGDLISIHADFINDMRAIGWRLRNHVIWDKGPGKCQPGQKYVTMTHEHVFMFVKSDDYFYDPDPLRKPLVCPADYRAALNPIGSNSPSVWHIAPARYPGNHGATLPVELVRRILALSCDDHSVVYDPFMGAGTVPLVAAMMGYRSIGIEIHEPYVKEALDRIAHAPLLLPSYESASVVADDVHKLLRKHRYHMSVDDIVAMIRREGLARGGDLVKEVGYNKEAAD